AFDHAHAHLAVGEDLDQLGFIDQIGALHGDDGVDHHGGAGKAESVGDVERVMPERVTNRARAGLGVVAAADRGPHAELHHHFLEGHGSVLGGGVAADDVVFGGGFDHVPIAAKAVGDHEGVAGLEGL